VTAIMNQLAKNYFVKQVVIAGCCLFFILLICIAFYGDNLSSLKGLDFNESAIKSAESVIPVVIQFRILYPDSHIKIAHPYEEPNPARLTSWIFLYDRYELTLDLPITLSDDETKVVNWSKPHFTLVEIISANGPDVRYNPDAQVDFGPEEWQKIVAQGGSFDAIGVHLNKTHPVSGFSGINQQYP